MVVRNEARLLGTMPGPPGNHGHGAAPGDFDDAVVAGWRERWRRALERARGFARAGE